MAKPKREPIVSSWCGVPRFACPFCAFDNLDEGKTREHIEAAHPVPAPALPKLPATPDQRS